jgi:TrmH family RNA methyltransferase
MFITSNSNDHVKAARLIRDGKDKSLLFVEGERLVADCLASRLPIPTAFHLPNPSDQIAPLISALQDQGTHLLSTTPEVLASLSDTVTPQGIIVLAERPQTIPSTFWSTLPASPLLVALDRIQDPGNLGTLLRTAEAAGAHGLITLSGTADPFSPKALRASMGSAFRLPILANLSSADLLTSAHLHHLQTFAATGTASLSFRNLDWTVPTLLLLGNEGRGIAPDLLAACDHPVRIPIHPPVESLNVAAAAAILLFEAAHQRTLKTPS